MLATRRVLVAVQFLIAAAGTAGGQELRGTVLDSASRQPVTGVVLVLLDSVGNARGRNITNERGEYRIALSPDVRRVRIVRLGYRPRELTVPVQTPGVTRLDVAMVSIPALLEPVRVSAAPNCERRADGAAALALLEQARAGLLTTIVAREANPAALKLLAFERTMEGNGDHIEKQRVRVESLDKVTTSFQAVNSGSAFVRDGFTRDSAGTRIYFGPDADVLLDDGFANGYCFHLQDPARGRPNQVGLGFSPADRRRGRVEIEGALWIDTVARALRDIDFRFVGLERRIGAAEPGGYVSFREMPNGVVLIDRWFFRLVGSGQDTIYGRRGLPMVHTWYFTRESGGEVARASWPDGHAWKAPLGTLWVHLVDRDGRPVRNSLLRLADTDYLGSPNARGDVEIADLLPGPYSATIIDTALASSGIALGTSLTFVAARDSIVRTTVVAPPADEFQRKACQAMASSNWTIAHVVTPDRAPVVGASWELGEEMQTAREYVYASGRTGSDGGFGFCNRREVGTVFQLRISRDTEPRQVVIRDLTDRLTAVTIELASRP